MKKVLMLVLAAVMIFTLAGCAQNPDTSQAQATEAAEETASASQEAAVSEQPEESASEEAPADSTGLTVGGIAHVENQWGSMLLDGMQAACDEAGVEFVSGNYNGDSAKEMELINTYEVTGVDGICASILETSNAAYEEIAGKGIPVAAVNTDRDTPFTSASVTYSNWGLGEVLVPYAVDFVRENLDGKPIYHTIRVIKGYVSDDRGDAFAEGMAEAFGEEYGTFVSESTTLDPQEAIQQTADALTANPDINIIFAECESSAIGAMAAIENAGLVGKVFVFAVDCSEQMCEYLLDEDNVTLQAASAQDSHEMGYQGCKMLIEIIKGERDAAPGEITYIPAQAMTKSNLDDVQVYLDGLRS
jgi:ABC-type sugar transport system substrate-binding protein